MLNGQPITAIHSHAPGTATVHSCRTLEFCYRIARLSTELSCQLVFILGMNLACS
jgi:hypothetical protein